MARCSGVARHTAWLRSRGGQQAAAVLEAAHMIDSRMMMQVVCMGRARCVEAEALDLRKPSSIIAHAI